MNYNKRKQRTLAGYFLNVSENNKRNSFEILSEDDEENYEVGAARKPVPKPPSIAMMEDVLPKCQRYGDTCKLYNYDP